MSNFVLWSDGPVADAQLVPPYVDNYSRLWKQIGRGTMQPDDVAAVSLLALSPGGSVQADYVCIGLEHILSADPPQWRL